jgi:hypothetical protein
MQSDFLKNTDAAAPDWLYIRSARKIRSRRFAICCRAKIDLSRGPPPRESTGKTGWRWIQSIANCSPFSNSLLTVKNAGNFRRASVARTVEIPRESLAPDFQLAEAVVSRRREPARVSRNDPSQPVHSGARSAEKGADSAPSLAAADPPLAACQRSRALSGPDRRCDFDPRTTRGSRRSCHSRSLGGRSASGCGHQSSFCVLVKLPSKDTAAVTAALSQHVRRLPRRCGARNLGPLVGDGATQELQHSHQCESLFL